jgi:hypothetical protein
VDGGVLADFDPWIEVVKRDFGQLRFLKRFMSARREATGRNLVKQNVTRPDKISIQLESLILAQNERWRQA